MSDITITRLTTADEYESAVDLQKIYWGDHADTLVAAHMLQSLCNHGGHTLGAWHQGRLVGFVMGFIGTDIDWEARDARPAMSSLLIMSKRMLVLPEYRGKNIGFRLKMAQRQVALKQGIRLVTWTFDPLLSPNAHLNIRKLGAMIRRYRVNYFGLTQQTSLRADRLIVEWQVTRRRVKARTAGKANLLTLQEYLARGAARVNAADVSDDWLQPAAEFQTPDADVALVEIPANFRKLESEQPQLAQDWRDHIRGGLSAALNRGYAITDFVRGGQRAFYVLNRHVDDDRE